MTKKLHQCRQKNYKSAIDNRIAVEKQILTEKEGGRYVVVQSPPTIISGLGAIPKDDGSIRIIHNCLRPEGNAVNDYANLDQNIKYQTVQDACELLKENACMAKID